MEEKTEDENDSLVGEKGGDGEREEARKEREEEKARERERVSGCWE